MSGLCKDLVRSYHYWPTITLLSLTGLDISAISLNGPGGIKLQDPVPAANPTADEVMPIKRIDVCMIAPKSAFIDTLMYVKQ